MMSDDDRLRFAHDHNVSMYIVLSKILFVHSYNTLIIFILIVTIIVNFYIVKHTPEHEMLGVFFSMVVYRFDISECICCILLRRL